MTPLKPEPNASRGGIRNTWRSLPRWTRWLLLGLLLFIVAIVITDACTKAAMAGEWEFDKVEAPTRAHVCINAAKAEEYDGKLRYIIAAPGKRDRLDTVVCSTRFAAEGFITNSIPHEDRPEVFVRRMHSRDMVVRFSDDGERVLLQRGKRWYKPWSWFRR